MLQIHHSKIADFLDLTLSIAVSILAFVPAALYAGFFIVRECIDEAICDYKDKKLAKERLND